VHISKSKTFVVKTCAINYNINFSNYFDGNKIRMANDSGNQQQIQIYIDEKSVGQGVAGLYFFRQEGLWARIEWW
jgi:hypothetical protein